MYRMSRKIRKIQINKGYFHAFLSLISQKTPKHLRSFLPVTTDMGNEIAFRLGKRAVRLIKEGNFELGAWEEIYDKVNNTELLSLVSSMRNALGYGVENKAIRGIVKAGYVHSIERWNDCREDLDSDILVIGDRAIKVADEFIKRNRIKVE